MQGFRQFVEDYKSAISPIDKAERIGTVQGKPIHRIVLNPEGKKTIVIVATIHGDEKSGTLGVIKRLSQGKLKSKNRIVIIPCGNPHGFDKSTRSNNSDKDINRHFGRRARTPEGKIIIRAIKKEKPDLVVALHEYDGEGAFLYHHGAPMSLCRKLVQVMSKRFKIKNGKIDNYLSLDKCDKEVKNGMIDCRNTNNDTLEDRMVIQGVPYITTELPNTESLTKRVQATVEMVQVLFSYL